MRLAKAQLCSGYQRWFLDKLEQSNSRLNRKRSCQRLIPFLMAPKSKDAGKGKGKGKDASSGESGGGKLKPAQQINCRHILCEKHSKKEDALAKLRDGAKFDDVAREFSEDKARQGGALGWKSRGSLHGDFEKTAYALETSTTSSPQYAEVKTSHGYHIIMVEGRK